MWLTHSLKLIKCARVHCDKSNSVLTIVLTQQIPKTLFLYWLHFIGHIDRIIIACSNVVFCVCHSFNSIFFVFYLTTRILVLSVCMLCFDFFQFYSNDIWLSLDGTRKILVLFDWTWRNRKQLATFIIITDVSFIRSKAKVKC